jgi:fructosamine-3-kinase
MAWRSHLFAALRHPAEPKLLLLRSDRSWRLPRVVVPDAVWSADAEVVVAAFERRLGTTPWLLRRLGVADDEEAKRVEAVYELELLEQAWEPPAHGRWVGRGDLDRLRLADGRQRELLEAYLEALESGDVPESRPPWARPGWLRAARAWIEREVARLGHTVNGIEQVKHWSISSILRVRTSGPNVYFKAPARLPLFVREAAVTAMLAERFPGYVPTPLALESERDWMLLPELELVSWDSPLATRCELLRRFAGLQRQAAGSTAELLADGCLDRRLDVLESQVEPLFGDPRAVARLTSEETKELRRLAPTLKDVCRRLADFEIPATLVHGDLHLGNVARLDGELVYFDWTDACIAHPFIDLLSLRWERDETRREALLDAYLEPWDGAETPERMREAVALAAVVIPLHHAVSYQRIVGALEPVAQSELDATHTFLREALARARELVSDSSLGRG